MPPPARSTPALGRRRPALPSDCAVVAVAARLWRWMAEGNLARGHVSGRGRRPFCRRHPHHRHHAGHAARLGQRVFCPGPRFRASPSPRSATPTGRCSLARSSARPPSATPSPPGRAGPRCSRPISETLVSATPLILAGTGVAIGFSTGVFNIGGQGQLICRGPGGHLCRFRRAPAHRAPPARW